MLIKFVWIGNTISAVFIGVATLAPVFLFPAAVVVSVYTGYQLLRIPSISRKSDIESRRYRKKFREELQQEFQKSAEQLQLSLSQREELVKAKVIDLQLRYEQLQQWQSQLLDTETKFTNMLHEQEQYYLEKLQQLELNAIAEIQLREKSIQQLQQKLMGIVNRPDPRQGFAAWVAQLLLQALEQNEVFCQLKGFYKIPGLRDVSVWVELANTPARKLESISKEVGTLVKLGEPTILWDADECVYEFRFAPQVDYEADTFDLVVDAETELPVIAEPESKNWFSEIINDAKSSHFMIHGPTGAGKSVLVDNLISSIHTEDCRVWVVDPKFPDSTWTVGGQRIKPQYRRWDGAIEGVLAMQAEVNNRLDASAKLAEAVPDELYRDSNYQLPVTKRTVDFWVVDEAAALHTLYKEQCSEAYRAVLWVGRSSLVKVILIGQNPNPSNYGLQIPDLGNCTRFYLGITALEALDRFVKPPREIKSKLKAQIYARLRAVKLKKQQGDCNPQDQYFALVVTTFCEPFVAQLPGLSVVTGKQQLFEVEDILDLVENAKQELPQYLKDLVAYAQAKETWITGSEFRQNRNRYKSVKAQEVNNWFEELEKRGIGKCDRTGTTLRYIFNKE